MKKSSRTFCFTATAAVVIAAGMAFAGRAMKVENAIWAHDELYDTVATDTSFTSPPANSVDILYNFDPLFSGLQGQRAISESAPGDRDFNGGRWHVIIVAFTEEGIAVHDPDGDGFVNFELTNAEQVLHHVSLGHLVLTETDIYFECPMIPNRGNN